jgi:N-acetyl-anhydromuramyl-L-alanine amidase AmpD
MRPETGVIWLATALATLGCRSASNRHTDQAPATLGDAIIIAGQRFSVGAPVVLWTDPGGYNAYQLTRHFADPRATAPHHLDGQPRYGPRVHPDHPGLAGGDWTLDLLRQRVDQFVIHYDVCGTSRTCFKVLHDDRGLSVHFMLDLDGTIYQTLDLRERAWHATIANDRSVGIEIANIGAYSPDDAGVLDEWYQRQNAATVITLPTRFGDGGLRFTERTFRPDRPNPVSGTINGRDLVMYDLTPQQYDSLAKLTAALAEALPAIRLEAPRDPSGAVATSALDPDNFARFSGVLGHYHVQTNKADPGPAFQWDRVLGEARSILEQRAAPPGNRS